MSEMFGSLHDNFADEICNVINVILNKHTCNTFEDIIKYQYEDGMKLFYIREAARLWEIEKNTFKLNTNVIINHEGYTKYVTDNIPLVKNNMEMIQNIKNIIITLVDKKMYLMNNENKYSNNFGDYINSMIVPNLYD